MTKPKSNTDYIDQLNAEWGDENASAEQESKPAAKEDFAALLRESARQPARKFSVGDRVRGEILVLGKEDVFVSIGPQSEAALNRRDLLEKDGTCPYKVGDKLDLYVVQVRAAEIRVSKNPTDKNLAEDLEDAFDMMLPVTGRVVEVVKGGVRVNLKGKLAFCPISQLDVNRTETGEEFVGKSLEFHITKFEEGGRNIVVSRRKLLEEERELAAGSFLEEHPDGDIVMGRVARLEPFGAFVELAPGIDGLVHVSEIAWSRIGHPSELLQPGQEVAVKILKREPQGNRMKISLSIKQAMSREEISAASAAKTAAPGTPGAAGDPWAKYPVGTIVTGQVNRKEPYGLFVQLEPGITGLLHQSRAAEHPEFGFEKQRVGSTVTVQVAEISRAERKIALQVPRDPGEDDWKTHQPKATASLGTLGGALGASLQAAMEKKKK